MLILTFIGKVLFGAGMAVACSITITILSLIFFSWIVDIFRLNYRRRNMWVLNVCLVIFCLSMILSFAYFIDLKLLI